MNLPGYDAWKLQTPEDQQQEPDYIRCDWCELWLIDGEGERIGRLYGHPKCAREQHDALAHGLMDELRADERANK